MYHFRIELDASQVKLDTFLDKFDSSEIKYIFLETSSFHKVGKVDSS